VQQFTQHTTMWQVARKDKMSLFSPFELFLECAKNLICTSVSFNKDKKKHQTVKIVIRSDCLILHMMRLF